MPSSGPQSKKLLLWRNWGQFSPNLPNRMWLPYSPTFFLKTGPLVCFKTVVGLGTQAIRQLPEVTKVMQINFLYKQQIIPEPTQETVFNYSILVPCGNVRPVKSDVYEKFPILGKQNSSTGHTLPDIIAWVFVLSFKCGHRTTICRLISPHLSC